METKEQEAPVLVYNGQVDADRHLEWMHRISEALSNFSSIFNTHFNEVLGSETPYNQEWYLQCHNGKAWDRLETLTEEFISNQNKAVRQSFTEYYQDCMEELKEAWKAYLLVYNTFRPGSGQKHFPAQLVRPENLPFKNGTIEFDLKKIDAVRGEFDEYLTNPELINFYNQLVAVRDAYRVMEPETKRLDMKFNLKPIIGGFPFFLYRDADGIWQLKKENLTNILTLKNH
jgi:hypothetical protein